MNQMVIFQMKVSACSGKLWISSYGWICAKNAIAFILLLKNVRMSGKTGRLIGPPFHRKGPIDSCWFFRSFVKMGRHFFSNFLHDVRSL